MNTYLENLKTVYESMSERLKRIEAFMGPGRSSSFTGDYDPEQLKMGIKIEFEHTTDSKIAERIAKDHLSEIPDYYTRLEKMEKEAGVTHEES
jgi:hypothetical protein